MWSYLRTFGYPISNEFPLLGRRVQLFQRALLIQGANGEVQPADLLDGSYLPYQYVDGLTLPTADVALRTGAPSRNSPTYLDDAQAFIEQYVPDTWNGLPVNSPTMSCATVA
jgi:hypothetical protein